MPKANKTKQEYEDVIRDGMARTLWVWAWMNWAVEQDPRPDGSAGPGEDWMDVAPPTPEAADRAAADLTKLIVESEEIGGATPLSDLFEIAMTFDEGKPFEFAPLFRKEGKWRTVRLRRLHQLVEEFGGALAMGSIGAGSWFDHHKDRNKDIDGGKAILDFNLPDFEIHYLENPGKIDEDEDDGQLVWDGKAKPPKPRKNSPGNAAPGMAGQQQLQIRAVLADRGDDIRCSEGCPGWAVFDTDRGFEIQACDECNAGARAAGLAEVTDDDVRLLPEAQQELAAMEAEFADNPRRRQRNPRGLTRKGERMYRAIEKGYRAVGEARAKEVAARTVLSRAKHGAPGLVKKPATGRR